DILRGFDPVSMETILTGNAHSRVLGKEIISEEDLPNFSRSSMDGYAVQAKDTFGASDSLPAFLELAGEVLMGQIPKEVVMPGTAIKISTGGMIPEGADAVVMVEYCHSVDENTIEVSRSVAPLENIIRRGDDFKKGDIIFKKGATLRPQDIGALAGLGIQEILVYKKPKVAIISTGDEVIPINQNPKPGQVRDINSYTLSAFCDQSGAIPVNMGLCKDNFDEMREMVGRALDTCDTVWISGGSSVGARDMTLKVLESFTDMQLLVHGIAISPGKPAIIAKTGNKAIFGLPGHVASAMVVAEVFLNPFLSWLSGEESAAGDHHNYKQAELTRNVESASGRDDYIRVKLNKKNNRFFAEPIFGKSGLISTLVESDGLVKIDKNTEGLYKGQIIDVMLFKPFD
ncbi:MAG: gephyrin-like molybdotransferase Glp, partial [Smithella sp.]